MTTLQTCLSVEEAIDRLCKLSPKVPEAAVILGSGINILERLSEPKSASFHDVFGIAPSVEGHGGAVEIGRLDGHLIAVLRGRFHLYEGHSWDTVTLPTRVICQWGVPALYLTNAAGGLNPAFQVGDLMLITGFRDHLSPQWQEVGLLPAIAAPAITCSNRLTERVWRTSQELRHSHPEFHPVHKGIYIGCLGPAYETMAEVKMLRRLKTDAVGMSTVPELLAALGSATLVAGISTITNSWSASTIHGHKAVLAAAQAASQQLEQLLKASIGSKA